MFKSIINEWFGICNEVLMLCDTMYITSNYDLYLGVSWQNSYN